MHTCGHTRGTGCCDVGHAGCQGEDRAHGGCTGDEPEVAGKVEQARDEAPLPGIDTPGRPTDFN